MKKTKLVIVLLIIIILQFFSACEFKKIDLDLDKTLADKLVIWWEEGVPYQLFAADALEKQFAHTSFEFKPFNPPPPEGYAIHNLLEMMRNEPSPDLIVFGTRFLPLMIEAEYLEPIPDTYARGLDYDIIEDMRSSSPDLALYALPFGRIAEGLFYNKAIFDEMNVNYPVDGMTWDEVIDLAKAFKSGPFNPIGVTAFDSMMSQLSLQWYNPETKQVNFKSREWNELTRILLELNELLEPHQGYLMSSFSVGDTAMVVGPLYGATNIRPGLLNYESNLRLLDVNWDIVSFPVFDVEQRLQPADQILGIGVPSRSENKQDAFKVMQYLLSHEVQLENSRKGLVSMRYDAETFMEHFGSFSLLAGKSISSLFSDAARGKRDPVLEFVHFTNSILRSYVNVEDSIKDIFLTEVEKTISQAIPKLMDERSRFIEEMRSL